MSGYKIEKEDNKTVMSLPCPSLFVSEIHGMSAKMLKVAKEQGEEAQPTNQKVDDMSGFSYVSQPIDIVTARGMKDISPHHSACIQAKKFSIMGLGFISTGDEVEESKQGTGISPQEAENIASSLLAGEAYVISKADEHLNPLTLEGFSLELYRSVEDFLEGGTGYLEVVRAENDAIIGLNWIPYENITPAWGKDSDNQNRMFYKYLDSSGTGTTAYYAPFGKNNRDWVYKQFYKDDTNKKKIHVSEVISFKVPSNKCRLFGYPDWLSANAFITLTALALQYKSDFYTNKGVLSYILSIMGEIPADKWRQIEKMVQSAVGMGNNFRNLGINLADPNAKVQVDSLAASDKTEEQFAKDADIFSQNIISAHRVPPILANILIPGKLGASNETIQAIVSFQLLTIGPYQRIIQDTLARTLGGEEGVDNLEPEDFRLRKITSQFNIAGLDTVGRMREEAVGATEADGSPRDVSEGLKD